MASLGLVHLALPLGLILFSHSWSTEKIAARSTITRLFVATSAASNGVHSGSAGEIVQWWHEKVVKCRLSDFPSEFLSYLNVPRAFDGSQSAFQLRFGQSPMAAVLLLRAAASSTLDGPLVAGQQKTREAPSVLQMIEGREQDLLTAAGIALAFFVVGWLCGGIYHVRRERSRRTKLRF